MTGNRSPLRSGRSRPSEGASLSLISETVPIWTPLTLTGAPIFQSVEVTLEHADEAARCPEHTARTDHDQGHDQDRKAGDHECTDDCWTDALSHDCLLSRLPLGRE